MKVQRIALCSQQGARRRFYLADHRIGLRSSASPSAYNQWTCGCLRIQGSVSLQPSNQGAPHSTACFAHDDLRARTRVSSPAPACRSGRPLPTSSSKAASNVRFERRFAALRINWGQRDFRRSEDLIIRAHAGPTPENRVDSCARSRWLASALAFSVPQNRACGRCRPYGFSLPISGSTWISLAAYFPARPPGCAGRSSPSMGSARSSCRSRCCRRSALR